MLHLANRYAGAKKIAKSTLARTATGSSTWFDRCVTGRVTIRSAVAVVQWLSDHWPEGILEFGKAPYVTGAMRRAVRLLSLDPLFVVCPGRYTCPVDARIGVLPVRDVPSLRQRIDAL